MRRAGFSLVEVTVALLVVIILLGIAAAPGSPRQAEQDLDDAAVQVVTDFRRVQALAVARNVTCLVTLASGVAGEDGYRIFQRTAATVVDAVPLPAGVRLDPADVGRTLRFGPLGAVDPATSLRVWPAAPSPYYLNLLSRDGNATRRVEVQAATGLARLP